MFNLETSIPFWMLSLGALVLYGLYVGQTKIKPIPFWTILISLAMIPVSLFGYMESVKRPLPSNAPTEILRSVSYFAEETSGPFQQRLLSYELAKQDRPELELAPIGSILTIIDPNVTSFTDDIYLPQSVAGLTHGLGFIFALFSAVCCLCYSCENGFLKSEVSK